MGTHRKRRAAISQDTFVKVVSELLDYERVHAEYLFNLIDLGATKDLSLIQFVEFFKHWDAYGVYDVS